MMTKFTNVKSVHVLFDNRDGVPTGLTFDGTLVDSDLAAEIEIDEDGMTAAMEVFGKVPNGTGYSFWSAEDWELVKRRVDPTGRALDKQVELGPVGKVVLGVVALAILTPFIGILWNWAIGVIQG